MGLKICLYTLNLFLLFGVSLAHLPCYQHTVDTCSEANVGNIVGNEPFATQTAEDCQIICQQIYGTDCQLFIFDSSDPNSEGGICTLHDGYLTSYLDSCKDASGPAQESLDGCIPDPGQDPNCWNYRQSACTFDGFEIASVSDVHDAVTCELFCEIQEAVGCRYFVFSAIRNFCTLYSEMTWTCEKFIGPKRPSQNLCDFVP